MSSETDQWFYFLKCDLVNEALDSLSTAWEQHNATIYETYSRELKHLTTNEKRKRKRTEYFTPPVARKSTRLAKLSKLPENLTPKLESARKLPLEKSSERKATTSGSSIASTATTVASSLGRVDSVKGKSAIPRTCATPDTKVLTASAAKRRIAEEEKRKAQLALMKEKEEKAYQQKQENLKNKAQMTKLKNEEKRKKIELIKKKEEEQLKEKRQKELTKHEEVEKRKKEKEEERRREMIRCQEAAKKKQQEFDLRKQQEEEERKARILRQEEQNRKKKEESESIKFKQEQIMRMINQHNSNFEKKHHIEPTQTKVEPVHTSFKHPLPPASNEAHQSQQQQPLQPALPLNSTFSVDKEPQPEAEPEPEPVKKKEVPQIKCESYRLTPPPKPKTPVNYDISDIKSDDGTDDEEEPRKTIPSWAKGNSLIALLDKQFAKSRRAREREIRQIFPSFERSIQLEDVFRDSSHVVQQKYDKRTSSAVWDTTINCSVMTDG